MMAVKYQRHINLVYLLLCSIPGIDRASIQHPASSCHRAVGRVPSRAVSGPLYNTMRK